MNYALGMNAGIKLSHCYNTKIQSYSIAGRWLDRVHKHGNTLQKLITGNFKKRKKMRTVHLFISNTSENSEGSSPRKPPLSLIL